MANDWLPSSPLQGTWGYGPPMPDLPTWASWGGRNPLATGFDWTSVIPGVGDFRHRRDRVLDAARHERLFLPDARKIRRPISPRPVRRRATHVCQQLKGR